MPDRRGLRHAANNCHVESVPAYTKSTMGTKWLKYHFAAQLKAVYIKNRQSHIEQPEGWNSKECWRQLCKKGGGIHLVDLGIV